MTELLCFRAQRRTSGLQAKTQSQLAMASTGKKKRKTEQRKAPLRSLVMPAASDIWFFLADILIHLESAWAKGEATDNQWFFDLHFLSCLHSNRFPIPHLTRKASGLHLWLIIDPLGCGHKTGRGSLTRSPALTPRSKGHRHGRKFLIAGSSGSLDIKESTNTLWCQLAPVHRGKRIKEDINTQE